MTASKFPTLTRNPETREITIVYNFIGAFDFTRAIEEARNTTEKEQRDGIAVKLHRLLASMFS